MPDRFARPDDALVADSRVGLRPLSRGPGPTAAGYGRTALQTWAHHLAELWPPTADVYAYFNNDQFGCAPRDARRFALAARRAGLSPTRVPPASETPTSRVA